MSKKNRKICLLNLLVLKNILKKSWNLICKKILWSNNNFKKRNQTIKLRKIKTQNKIKTKIWTFLIYLLILLILAGRLYFNLIIKILNLNISLAIRKMILIKAKIAIDFLKCFLLKIFINLQKYYTN